MYAAIKGTTVLPDGEDDLYNDYLTNAEEFFLDKFKNCMNNKNVRTVF